MNDLQIMIENIAKVCYEANRAYCAALGDFSHPMWVMAPDWAKETNIKGVQFHLDNPNSKPEDSHRSWCHEKVKTRWVYGKVKDPEKKTHPCLVLFDKLPEEQQKKDTLFLSIVRALS